MSHNRRKVIRKLHQIVYCFAACILMVRDLPLSCRISAGRAIIKCRSLLGAWFTLNASRPRKKLLPFGKHFQLHFTHANAWVLLKIALKFVPKVYIKIFQHLFSSWLGADQAASHKLIQWWLIYWHIYALLGLNGLIMAYFIFSINIYHRCPVKSRDITSFERTILGVFN